MPVFKIRKSNALCLLLPFANRFNVGKLGKLLYTAPGKKAGSACPFDSGLEGEKASR